MILSSRNRYIAHSRNYTLVSGFVHDTFVFCQRWPTACLEQYSCWRRVRNGYHSVLWMLTLRACESQTCLSTHTNTNKTMLCNSSHWVATENVCFTRPSGTRCSTPIEKFDTTVKALPNQYKNFRFGPISSSLHNDNRARPPIRTLQLPKNPLGEKH